MKLHDVCVHLFFLCVLYVSSMCCVVERVVWVWDLGGGCLDVVHGVNDLCVCGPDSGF